MRYLVLAAALLAAPVVVYAQPDTQTTPAAPTAPAAPAAPAMVSIPTADLPSAIPGEPTSPEQALDLAKSGVEMAKAKNWFGLSAAIILVLMFVLKLTGLFTKIGKRWAYLILTGLGVAAMLLSRFAADLSWNAAWLVLTSAPVAGLLSDFVKRGIMGKEPTTSMKP